jgi:hypothetical protein
VNFLLMDWNASYLMLVQYTFLFVQRVMLCLCCCCREAGTNFSSCILSSYSFVYFFSPSSFVWTANRAIKVFLKINFQFFHTITRNKSLISFKIVVFKISNYRSTICGWTLVKFNKFSFKKFPSYKSSS